MDPGTILGFSTAYLAALVGIFLLCLPYIVLLVALLIAAGILQLLLLPFALLVRKLRRTRPRPIPDSSWILNPTNSQPPEQILNPTNSQPPEQILLPRRHGAVPQ